MDHRNGLEHEHDFIGTSMKRGEKRTRWVIALTATVMVVEITAGVASNALASTESHAAKDSKAHHI